MFLNLCALKGFHVRAAKDFGKNYLETLNIVFFTHKICKICSQDHFYLEKLILGRKMTRESMNSSKGPFFREQLIVAAKMRKTEWKIVVKAFFF